MKMFVIVYVDYLDESVTNEFKQAGYTSYMKFHGLTGEDEKYEAMIGSPGSHGKIKSLFIHATDEKIPHLLDIVKKLKERYPTCGFRAFTFPLEEYAL
ncbi:MAG TPA: hypothetical protein VGJ94_11005 [Syntrophorhabdaceae bacterium]|jgi:hypothetical protein